MDWIISPILDPATLKHQTNPFDFSVKSAEREDLSLGSARSVRVGVDPARDNFMRSSQPPNTFSLFADENATGARPTTHKRRFVQTETRSLRQHATDLDGAINVTEDRNVSKNRSQKIKKDRSNAKCTSVRLPSELTTRPSKGLSGLSRAPVKGLLGQSACESLFSEVESVKRVKSHFGYNKKKQVSSGFARNHAKQNRPKFKKIFDPREFYAGLQTAPESEDLREKFNIFLFLPQLLLLNNVCQGGKASLKVESRGYESRRLTAGKGSSETNTNVSMNTSQRLSAKLALTEDQKHRKISKKLRRAWNLNQQISVNIFKKQVRFREPGKRSRAENPNEQGERVDASENDVFGMKRARRVTTQRRSKLEAKNKIKKSMMRQRKQRAPLGEEKEHLEYKRLVGLKRDLSEFRRASERGARGQRDFEGLRGTPGVARRKGNFEYVEFLDFSFKNINKSNFLAVDVQSK